ncbi:hypothetical protein Ais01nite_14130 [Asanoa ishikariensis]|uniref:Putative adhesin n=1 Tax=Asanoa ishikariensis TaxID=137265 RepID=A0A1H3UK78_9ACTN|nr:DUF4097 family beta strand repeat-containing protein [Asanoa ishikariensis]GIF63378.1 hypothetical protein Ais01nite_14130 [Asanoa ishikariensis]SDZ62431.1 Putative adhesin [Asanoa ishikariensis]
MPTFATPNPIAAIVEVAGARVRVTASDRTDASVVVAPIDAANRKDVKVAEKTSVDFANGRLSVKTTASGDKSGSVAITIDLPAGSSLRAYLAHSDVHAAGSLGGCEVHMASGRVQLDRVETLRANVASGEVAVDRITGGADIDGGAFTMRIGSVGQTVKFSNSGGQAWIGHAAGDLELSSASCDFDIDRADGNVTAGTASGAIRIGRMTNGHANLTNGSGTIEVGISEGATADVDVRSERASVRDSVSGQSDPSPSDGKVSVHARTRHGDIVIRRAV